MPGRRVGEPLSTAVSFVLVGRSRSIDKPRIVSYLSETDDPQRVMNNHRSSYHDLHWERCTETYERVTLEDLERERDL